MQKIKISKILQVRELIFAILVALSFALGTYLTIKLIPINKSIDALVIRVDAQEKVDDVRAVQINTMGKDITIIKEDTAYIRGLLDR